MTLGPPPRDRRVSLRSPRALAMTKTPRTVGRRLRLRRRRRRRRSSLGRRRRPRPRRRRGSRRRGPPTLCLPQRELYTRTRRASVYYNGPWTASCPPLPAPPISPRRHITACGFPAVRSPFVVIISLYYFLLYLPICIYIYILYNTAHTNYIIYRIPRPRL